MFFDTHAHYDDAKFDADRDEVLSDLRSHNVGLVVNPGCTVASSQFAISLAEKYPFVYAAVGIHPENCAGADEEDFAAIRALAEHPRVKAIGEIGLDYYWAENPPREFQQLVLRRMLSIAAETGLPAIIHDREAHADCLAIVKEFPTVTGVYHCYSGSVEDAKTLIRLGWMLSFNGAATFKNARKAPEVIRAVPLEKLMIETDSPYLAPAPHRGKRNDSRYVPLVAAKIAEYKGIPLEEVERVTTANAIHFFHLEDELAQALR